MTCFPLFANPFLGKWLLVYCTQLSFVSFISKPVINMTAFTEFCLYQNPRKWMDLKENSLWFSLVLLLLQSCPTLCDSMDCSTPGLPVLHCLPKFAQVHVHGIGDAIQLSFISVTSKQIITFRNIVFTVNNKTATRSYYELLNILNVKTKLSIFQTDYHYQW